MKKIILALFAFLISLTGCAESTSENNLYFSIRTRPLFNNYGENYADYLFTTVEAGRNHQIKKYGKINLFSGYSSSLVDADNQIIYYINRLNIDPENYRINDGDQLYSYDIKDNTTTKHTEILYGNNYIFKNHDKIYLVSRTNDIHGQQLFEYDLETGSLVNIGPDKEYNVRIVNYNPINEEIILSAYKESEFDEAMENQDDSKSGIFEDPTNYIYSYKDGVLTYLFETGKGKVLEIAANDDYIVYYFKHDILFCTENRTETYEDNYFTYNRKTGEIAETLLGNEMENLYTVYYLSEDNSYIYCEHFLDGTESTFELVKYDLNTNRSEVILDYYENDLSDDPVVVLMKHE